MCGCGPRDWGPLFKPQRGIFSCSLETITRGCRRLPPGTSAPGFGRPQSPHSHRQLSTQCISGPSEALGKDTFPSQGMVGNTSPPPEDLGLASIDPPFRTSAESHYVPFLSSSQPHEASRSFLGGSRARSAVLTCARMTRGRRPVLPQWLEAASAQKATAAPGRRGGAGQPRPGNAPLAGSRLSPHHLPLLARSTIT